MEIDGKSICWWNVFMGGGFVVVACWVRLGVGVGVGVSVVINDGDDDGHVYVYSLLFIDVVVDFLPTPSPPAYPWTYS